MTYKRMNIRNSSMTIKMFITIILFFIIPLVSVVFMFNFYMINYSETEISKSVITNLKTIKNMNDLLVDSVSRDVIRLSLNTALEDLKGIDDYNSLKGNSDNLIKLNNVRNILRSNYNSNYRLQSIYVYLESANYIITSGEEGIVLKSQFNDMEWLDVYNEKKESTNGTIWLDSRRIGSINGESAETSSPVNVMTYVLSLNNLSLNLDGVIVVNINEKELSNLINNTELNNSGYVFIMNNKGETISHVDKNLISKNIKHKPFVNKVISSTQDIGYIIENIDNKKQLIAYNKTKFNDWIYVGVFSLNNLMENTNALKARIGVILLLIIFLGILMSYIIAKKLYNPLNTLVKTVKQLKGIDLEDDENEMALLSRAFSTISKQEDALLDILEKNKVAIKEKHLMNLLKGDLDNFDLEYKSEEEFPFKYFICSVLSIDKLEKFTAVYSKEQQYYMKMLIMQVCEEVFSPFYKCYSALYDKNRMVIIMNFDNNNREKVVEQLNKGYQKVQEELSKISDNTVTIAIGGCHIEKVGISFSFREALEALKCKLIYGYGKIIYWNDAIVKKNEYYYPSNKEKHIMNNLILGLKEETLFAVKELITDVKNRPHIISGNVLQIFIQLVGTTVKRLMDKNINISDIFEQDYNIYQVVSSQETIEDLELWFMEFYSKIFDYMIKYDVEDKDHCNRVFDFIQANLRNNIDVTAIADYTGISYSYVRKLVKDKTGKSVVDYINGLRIEQSKKLLKETKMGMASIAQEVGYNNYQSFNRFFQKYEGITPGEYRNVG